MKNKDMRVFGLRVDSDNSSAMDLFIFQHVPETNTIRITSKCKNITFGISVDHLIEFINKNKPIIFDDF